ncbi:MAG: Rid family hydrolase [Acidimicrobiales bacterium]
MANKEVVSGPGVPPVIGPYSAGVRGGGLLFVSGQAGIDPATGTAAGEDFAAQARQSLRNVEAVVTAGGSRMDLVTSTTVLIADFAHFAELNEIFAGFFPVDPPARMTIQNTLPAGLLISVGCVAVLA